jgi:tRNA modification GTPase
VHAKADISGQPPEGSLAVSSVTGEGLKTLLHEIGSHAKSLLPADDAVALNRRQAAHIEEAADALGSAAIGTDLVLVAEDLRRARGAFDRLTGRAGVEDVLDALFSRFCLGK